MDAACSLGLKLFRMDAAVIDYVSLTDLDLKRQYVLRWDTQVLSAAKLCCLG